MASHVTPQDAVEVRPVPVEIRGQGGLRGAAVVQVAQLTVRARVKRALRTSAVLLGLSLACLPIPPLHWVLTPGFFVASIVAFFVRMGTGALATGELVCPKCHGDFPLEPQPPAWPLDVTCHGCRAQLHVVQSDSTP